MSLSSPGIAILFEHSEWLQQLFAGLDRRGIAYDRLLAAELSYDPRARTSQYALVVNRMSPSAYRLGAGSANSGSGLTRGETLSLVIEEKYDQVRRLINMGKERGYLLYDEVNDMLPVEVHSSEEIDDLLSTFERYGIDIYEDVSSAKAARAAVEAAEIS